MSALAKPPTARAGSGLALLAFVTALALLLAPVVRASARRSAKVTYVAGAATSQAGGRGAKTTLKQGSRVFEHDLVETAAGARVELETADGSVVRVGPQSRLLLQSAYFGASGVKRFSAKLFFGRVWTKVSGLVGGDSKFEVQTDNAVAGVRGTTFRVDARRDHSVILRVYAGSVAMASTGVVQKHLPTTGGRRTQIQGPSRISAREWEKLVGNMMQLAVNADGTAGDPTPFTAKDDAGDDWAAWNLMMDARESGH